MFGDDVLVIDCYIYIYIYIASQFFFLVFRSCFIVLYCFLCFVLLTKNKGVVLRKRALKLPSIILVCGEISQQVGKCIRQTVFETRSYRYEVVMDRTDTE